MNVYELTKCTKCGEIIIVSEIGSFFVHGAKNLEKALALLRSGYSLQQAAARFCSYCGSEIPCGCGNQNPQRALGSI